MFDEVAHKPSEKELAEARNIVYSGSRGDSVALSCEILEEWLPASPLGILRSINYAILFSARKSQRLRGRAS